MSDAVTMHLQIAGDDDVHSISECTKIGCVNHKNIVEPDVVRILLECVALYKAKASDYNHPTKHVNDPLSNFRVAEELGVPAYLGALVRMADKWERIKTLTHKRVKSGEGPTVKDESIEDTLMDIINYGAIVLALYRQQKND